MKYFLIDTWPGTLCSITNAQLQGKVTGKKKLQEKKSEEKNVTGKRQIYTI